MACVTSTLQGERPTISTILRANQALKEFQENREFELVFRPVDPLTCGVMVVADAGLGNVSMQGLMECGLTDKVYSQACHFVLVADQKLMSGESGLSTSWMPGLESPNQQGVSLQLCGRNALHRRGIRHWSSLPWPDRSSPWS